MVISYLKILVKTNIKNSADYFHKKNKTIYVNKIYQYGIEWLIIYCYRDRYVYVYFLGKKFFLNQVNPCLFF